MTQGPPNVVIVVLDTGRGDVVDGVPLDGPQFAGAAALRRSSLVFPDAFSPSTWTYPSHASLFTGLYPWENASLSTELAPLRADLPHLARTLAHEGYRTVSLSANPLVSPWTGLAAPFQTALWSQWWHLFLRIPSYTKPVTSDHDTSAGPPPLRALPSNLFTIAKRALLRYPSIPSALTRWAGNVLGVDGASAGRVDDWIEPVLSKWIAAQPPEAPVFAFVNLMEAHEPYLPARQGANRRQLRQCRQDREEFLAGTWVPSPGQLADLRALYADGVGTALARVSAMVDLLIAHGRFENTIFVLTGDHGQEFGELDGLFHGTYPGDPQVRVPLWLKMPGQEWAGKPARGMASLVDVSPTILRAAGLRDPVGTSGQDLAPLADGERAGPVLSFSEQLPDADGFRMRKGSQWIGLNRFWVAARQQSGSVVVDTYRSQMYRANSGSGHLAGRPERISAAGDSSTVDSVGKVQEAIRRALEERTLLSTDQRLRSWGYF